MHLFRHRSVRVAAAAAIVAGAVAARTTLNAQPPAGREPAPGSAAAGKKIYDAHCATCHGSDGRGDGPAAPMLSPAPRDFSTGTYKLRSTETGQLPTDDDLRQTVRKGVYGTAMPNWEGVLSDGDIRAVVDYVKTFSPRFAAEHPQPVPIAANPPSGADSAGRGRAVYEKLKCASCHGTDGRGAGAVATAFMDDWGRPMTAADLTEPWTFRGGATARDIYLRFRTGMAGTPMPSFVDAAGDAELWDLANYVAAMARKPVWSMRADEVAALYARQEREAQADPVKRGQYLVHALNCPLCHTPQDAHSHALPGLFLAGGMRIRIEPFGDYYTCNLTSDKETGVGALTDDQLKRTLTQGILHDGTRLPPYPMDWAAFSTLTPSDLDAIVAYLRTVPPVYNRVPAYSRPLLPLYLWGKFKMLVLRIDPPLIFYPGNAGQTRGGRS